MKKGDRVGAIFGTGEGAVSFLGYGIFAGYEVPKGAYGPMADALVVDAAKNPKIVLDSGRTVWGCECWWGPEGQIKVRLDRYRKMNYEIVDVDIDTIRVRYRAGESGIAQ